MKTSQVMDKQERVQALSHHNTVFPQLLKLVSRHEFEALAMRHHEGRTASATCCSAHHR